VRSKHDADRVERGGSFSLTAAWLRAAYRYDYSPGNRNDSLGLRVALDTQKENGRERAHA